VQIVHGVAGDWSTVNYLRPAVVELTIYCSSYSWQQNYN